MSAQSHPSGVTQGFSDSCLELSSASPAGTRSAEDHVPALWFAVICLPFSRQLSGESQTCLGGHEACIKTH